MGHRVLLRLAFGSVDIYSKARIGHFIVLSAYLQDIVSSAKCVARNFQNMINAASVTQGSRHTRIGALVEQMLLLLAPLAMDRGMTLSTAVPGQYRAHVGHPNHVVFCLHPQEDLHRRRCHPRLLLRRRRSRSLCLHPFLWAIVSNFSQFIIVIIAFLSNISTIHHAPFSNSSWTSLPTKLSPHTTPRARSSSQSHRPRRI